MKRDLDLLRLILLAIEADPTYRRGELLRVTIPGYSEDDTQYHLMLLGEAGLVNVKQLSSGYFVTRLTWEGHEFLDTIRKDSIWNKAKGKALETTGALGLNVLKALALKYARQAAGLEP